MMTQKNLTDLLAQTCAHDDRTRVFADLDVDTYECDACGHVSDVPVVWDSRVVTLTSPFVSHVRTHGPGEFVEFTRNGFVYDVQPINR